VFHALTDSREHGKFTDSDSIIDPRDGGKFSYFGGSVYGVFEAVIESSRIVQTLHAADWPEGHNAFVEQTFEECLDGKYTLVKVKEEGIPDNHLETVIADWSGYWGRLAHYLRKRRIALVNRFVEQYKNQHDWDCVDEFIAADCKVHIPVPGLPQGREGMRVNGRAVCTAFPDVSVTREFIATEGDIVLERAHADATHQGELIGVPATGRAVKWTELHAYRVTDGMISEVWSEPDLMGIMVQIGVLDMPGP
jgi:predicted ester cyclase